MNQKHHAPSIQNELAQERRDCVERMTLLDEILAALELNPDIAPTLQKIDTLKSYRKD